MDAIVWNRPNGSLRLWREQILDKQGKPCGFYAPKLQQLFEIRELKNHVWKYIGSEWRDVPKVQGVGDGQENPAVVDSQADST